MANFRLRELQVSYRPAPADVRIAAEAAGLTSRSRLTMPRNAAAIFAPLRLEPVEVFQALYLDTKHRPLALYTIGRGTLDSTTAHPRDVFRGAILVNAATVITAHNHPSGDATPSPDDRRVWDRMNAAADLIGISILDHLIITDTEDGTQARYYSCQEAGQMGAHHG